MDMPRRLLATAALLRATPAFAQFAPYAAPEPGRALSRSGRGRAVAAGPVGERAAQWRHQAQVRCRAKSLEIPSGATLPSSLDLKANAQATTYMVNGLCDFRLAPSWSANVGVGLGAAMVRVNNIGNSSPFAYQAMTGVEYALAPQLRLGVEYKFLGTDSLNLRVEPFDQRACELLRSRGPGDLPLISAHPPRTFRRRQRRCRVRRHAAAAVLAQFRGLFRAQQRCAQSREPRDRAPGQRPPPKTTRRRTSNIGGHTDTTGPASYNQQLSNRRAEAVRKELIAQGVAPDDIATSAYGESDLAVPTANNVNEPRNRRFLISVNGPGT
jgi:OOP family OmpA-OmpF porin